MPYKKWKNWLNKPVEGLLSAGPTPSTSYSAWLHYQLASNSRIAALYTLVQILDLALARIFNVSSSLSSSSMATGSSSASSADRGELVEAEEYEHSGGLDGKLALATTAASWVAASNSSEPCRVRIRWGMRSGGGQKSEEHRRGIMRSPLAWPRAPGQRQSSTATASPSGETLQYDRCHTSGQQRVS